MGLRNFQESKKVRQVSWLFPPAVTIYYMSYNHMILISAVIQNEFSLYMAVALYMAVGSRRELK